MQDNHTGVLLEDIQDKLQLLLEVVSPIARDVAEMKPQVAQLTADMKIVKAVQKDQGRDLKQVNSRLGHVENKLGHMEDYLVMQGMPQRA